MKAHIRQWVNEKHDVITAEDMKTALKSHGGVKGVRAAVVQVDATKESTANKIQSISLLNNFSFEKEVFGGHSALDLADSCPTQLEVVQQGETGLKVLKEFGPRSTNLGSVRHVATPRSEIFSCCESTCVLTFKTQGEAEVHMDAGKHVRAIDCESVYDTARKKWASRVTEVHVATGETQRIAFEEAGPSRTAECRSEGWALKTTKRAPRMEEKVKAFLIQKFNQGAAGGQRADPVQVAREMKCVRDVSGKLQFRPEEWRTAQQISNFFSQMSTLQRQRLPDESQEEEFADEDLKALQSEDSIQAIRQEVHKDMESPKHPIEVGAVNVCALSHARKL